MSQLCPGQQPGRRSPAGSPRGSAPPPPSRHPRPQPARPPSRPAELDSSRRPLTRVTQRSICTQRGPSVSSGARENPSPPTRAAGPPPAAGCRLGAADGPHPCRCLAKGRPLAAGRRKRKHGVPSAPTEGTQAPPNRWETTGAGSHRGFLHQRYGARAPGAVLTQPAPCAVADTGCPRQGAQGPS